MTPLDTDDSDKPALNKVQYEITNNGGILSVYIQALDKTESPAAATNLGNELNAVILPILERWKHERH